MVAAMRLAITGATGFVGQRLVDRAIAAGHHVVALTRRDQNVRGDVTWVPGSLEVPESLARLCDSADAVIHVAGVINAPDAAGFEAGNVTGTKAMLDAASAGGVRRFIHVSSLAAREPELSLYGASKARSEAKVKVSGVDWAVVRPPAVYGPGDRETLELFKMAKKGFVMLPPQGKLSLLHADDLADLLLALSSSEAPSSLTIEPDDGHQGGWTHKQFAQMLGDAFGKRVTTVSTPAALLRLGATLDRLARGNAAKLTADRAAYFCYPDWTVASDKSAPPELWKPKIASSDGIRQTARWYEEQGWL